jgi:hypothetical protein
MHNRIKDGIGFLEHEFARERASALGRLGQALETALDALVAFDAARVHCKPFPAQAEVRKALVEDASLALWHFLVQREVCGLRDLRHVLTDYRVPADVAARIGAFPPVPAPHRHTRHRQPNAPTQVVQPSKSC